MESIGNNINNVMTSFYSNDYKKIKKKFTKQKKKTIYTKIKNHDKLIKNNFVFFD